MIVTGLTATRMLDIEASSVVGGSVDGSGHLILTRHDGSTIDGGVIVGPDAVDIYNDQTIAGVKTFTSKLQIDNMLIVGPGGTGSTIIAGSNSSPGKVPVAEFYKDTGTAGEEANLVIRGNSASGAGGSVAGGRGVGILLKHSTEASTNESNKHWAITAYSTLAYGNSPSLIFRNGTLGANALTLDGTNNLATFGASVKTLGYTLTVGNAGTGTTGSVLDLSGGSGTGGGASLRFSKNSVSRWTIYTLGDDDGNLYVRDNTNAKMVATFKAGGTGASVLDVTDKLTLGASYIPANGGLYGVTAAGTANDVLSWTMGDNDFFRIRTGGASNAGWVEIATADDGTEPIYVRQYTPGWSAIARTLTLLDGSGNTSVPQVLYVGDRIIVGSQDGGGGVSTNNWFRSFGATGWYSQDYAVGIYATAAGWVETYNGANFKVNGQLQVAKSGQGTTNVYPLTPTVIKMTSSSGAISTGETTVLTGTTTGDGTHSVNIFVFLTGLSFTVLSDRFAWAIKANGTTIASGFVYGIGAASQQANPLSLVANHVPAAGSTTTYTVTFVRSTGSGTLTVLAGASAPGLLIVSQPV